MAEESAADLSLEKVQEFIKGQVESYAEEAFKSYQVPVPQQQQARSQQQEAEEQLRQTLNPYIQPGLNAAQLAAADVNDKVDFYLKRPDLADMSDDVEKMFNDLKSQGRAIPRVDIANYLVGKMANDDPEKFDKRSSARKQAQLDKLSGATDMGLGALDKAKNDPVWSNVRNMPLDELEKALDGVSF